MKKIEKQQNKLKEILAFSKTIKNARRYHTATELDALTEVSENIWRAGQDLIEWDNENRTLNCLTCTCHAAQTKIQHIIDIYHTHGLEIRTQQRQPQTADYLPAGIHGVMDSIKNDMTTISKLAHQLAKAYDLGQARK